MEGQCVCVCVCVCVSVYLYMFFLFLFRRSKAYPLYLDLAQGISTGLFKKKEVLLSFQTAIKFGTKSQ